MFFPYYRMRGYETGEKQFPQRTFYAELPCGDDALLYASLMVVQGWLKTNGLNQEAEQCGQILGRMSFQKCIHKTDCNGPVNGLEAMPDSAGQADQFWGVPLTVNAD